MRIDRGSRCAQAPQSIMIVERVERADMAQSRPPARIHRRIAHHRAAHPVHIGRWPPTRIRLDRHTLGAQRIEFGGHPVRALHHLQIRVAVQQEKRDHALEKLRPTHRRRRPRDQRGERMRIGPHRHWRARHPLGNGAHSALTDRIAHEPLAYIAFVSANQVAA